MRPSRSRSPKSAPRTTKKDPVTLTSTPDRVPRKRRSQTITLSPEAIVLLEEIVRETGTSKSGVIEALIRRARIEPSPEVLSSGEPDPTSPPPVVPPPDPVPASQPRKKKWGEAVREFRETRERMRK